MNTKTLWPTALALAISACLLGGCGGGGSNGMVRTESLPPSPPPSPPPPPPPPAEACPAPVTSDCVVEVPALGSQSSEEDLTGGRQSDFALIKTGTGVLKLFNQLGTFSPPVADYRFSAGTTVEGGDLWVEGSASLHSDVIVQAPGNLEVFGTVTGDVTSDGTVFVWDTVVGDVSNNGILTPGSSIYDEVVPARIDGNFSQTPNGTLDAFIGATKAGFLTVTGRADIDGTLRLVAYHDEWGPYPLPSAPLSVQVLHADGGVFGRFAQWTSPGLFITGSVRYQPNDVYFDASAISVAPTMAAAKAGDALTLQSAAHFDAALGGATASANTTRDSQIGARQQFLASAGAIQRLRTWDQAIRTFDSLSGSGYTAAAEALMQQASMPAADLISRMGNLRAGSKSGAWSGSAAMLASGTGGFSESRAGFDGWLTDGVLLGASLGWGDGSLRFDRSGGAARDRSPQWDIYLRRDLSAGAYVFGDIGYGRHLVDFNRSIDLGIAQQPASAMRALDVTRGYLETGRDFRIGPTRLTPFGAISHVVLHGGGFAEQGATGFELIAQPATYRQTSAAAGLRVGRDWRSGDRWTALDVSTGYRQILAAHDDARAAFAGVPDVTFALGGAQRHRNSGWLQVNLATGNERWNWLLSYDRQASDEALSLGMKFGF